MNEGERISECSHVCPNELEKGKHRQRRRKSKETLGPTAHGLASEGMACRRQKGMGTESVKWQK